MTRVWLLSDRGLLAPFVTVSPDPINLVISTVFISSHGVTYLPPSLCLRLQSAVCMIALLIQMVISGQYFVIITWVLGLLIQAHCVICSVTITGICWLTGFISWMSDPQLYCTHSTDSFCVPFVFLLSFIHSSGSLVSADFSTIWNCVDNLDWPGFSSKVNVYVFIATKNRILTRSLYGTVCLEYDGDIV